ncbi:GNAT family N-acetyltransferase [Georgenia sp. SYP-B2076]|uniref:GNAT family N-acetyltransferase n=1 Tax=Georgenia sp. SYP-B2076 TaxID=2495881 RepID=UPI00197A8D3E|nr:GNAT family N-acetyltransferase [Georgenia sp. SYP-B2076]
MTKQQRPGPTPVGVHPLAPERWPDLQRLFAGPGDQSRCWCAWWRLPGKDFDTARVAGRRDLMAERAGRAPAPGLLAYDGDVPVGWVAVAPRPEYPRIPRSAVAAYDEGIPGCWSVTCFYVPLGRRGQGLTTVLLAAAVGHARAHGAQFLEGYPVDPAGRGSSSAMYPGTLGVFLRAGFAEVARRRGRPTVRMALGPPSGTDVARPSPVPPETRPTKEPDAAGPDQPRPRA